MSEENKIVEFKDEELEKIAAADDKVITILEKDLSFTYEGVIYHVCEDTVVYSLDQIVRAYKDINEPYYSDSF